MENFFFDGWVGLLRITVAAPIVYGIVIVYVRLSGKRSTSQMNSFDWIVTVAMGSIVGSGIMLNDITIAEALWAIALLLFLQWALTLAVSRVEIATNLVKATPRLLYYRGTWCETALRQERVTRGEVLSAIRSEGFAQVDAVLAVILETDASMSVVPESALEDRGDPTAFAGIRAEPEVAEFPSL